MSDPKTRAHDRIKELEGMRDAPGWGKIPERRRQEDFRRQSARRLRGQPAVCPHCGMRHEHHDKCGRL